MNQAERWRQVRALFEEAAELNGSTRDDFLERSCVDPTGKTDASLRSEVELLLAADREIDGKTTARDPIQESVSAAIQSSAEPTWQGREIGPYRVTDVLGRGGMGVVLSAQRNDGEYQKEVAIKLLSGALHTNKAKQRFYDERQILATLEHPAIARLIEGGTTEDGSTYFVMEKVEGSPIDRYCDQNSLNLSERLRLMIKVCNAIAHAHSRLVVHRDLKPSNVQVTDDGKVKLLDFGIAKLLSEDDTPGVSQTVDWLLTPEYASPEQIEGAPITVATDVYGLGALLYKLLAGAPPFADAASQGATQLIRSITETRPAPPSRATSNDKTVPFPPGQFSQELDAVVLNALRKEPDRRYGSAQQLADDLKSLLKGWPVSAMPDSLAYRSSKYLRRHWIPVLAAASVALTMIAGLITRSIEADRARKEAQIANQVSQFLETLFDASTPEGSLGEEVTARDLLDRGATRIRNQLVNQPAIQARLFSTIASSYSQLGRYPEAESLYADALGLLQEHTPSDQLGIAHATMELGALRTHAGRFREGEPLLRQSLAIYESELASSDPVLIGVLGELAGNLSAQAHARPKLEEAAAMLSRVVEFYRASPEGYSRELAEALRELSGVSWEQGNFPLQIAFAEEALAAWPRPDQRHPFTLSTKALLGEGLTENREFARAQALFEKLCPVISDIYGPRHDEASGCQSRQAVALLELGLLSSAEQALLGALNVEHEIYGVDHHYPASTEVQIGRLRHAQGKPEEAAQQINDALPRLKRGYGTKHHLVAAAQHALGAIRLEQERYTEARVLLEEALENRRTWDGETGARYQDTAELLRVASR